MSQHYCSTQYQSRSVEVVLGYDRPLRCFFMTVTHAEAADIDSPDDSSDQPAEKAVYSYLADPSGAFNHDLDYYRAKLLSLGILVPESMFRETRQDAINNVGDRMVQHHGDGRVETIFDAQLITGEIHGR